MVISLSLTALALNGISAYLLFFDQTKQSKKRLPENHEIIENGNNSWLAKKLIIYAIAMTLLCIGISISLSLFNGSDSFLFNLKRICLLSLLWPIAFIDFKSYRIPNLFIVAGLSYRVIIFAFELFFESDGIWARTLSELIASVALVAAAFLCGLLLKNSIGFGDIKLFIIMGLMLGLDGIWSSVFVSLIVSFIISVFLLATKKKGRKDAIPFAPAIMIGTYISIFLTGM